MLKMKFSNPSYALGKDGKTTVCIYDCEISRLKIIYKNSLHYLILDKLIYDVVARLIS